MAELEVTDSELVLHLSRTEKLEAVHGDLREPLSAVREVQVLNNAHDQSDHGLKVGLGMRGVTEVASIRTASERLFAVVHHNTPRGLRINFENATYDAWIVGCTNPEATKRLIDNR